MKSIIEDQQDWTMRDWEVAADTLGDQARFLIGLLLRSVAPDPGCDTSTQLWLAAQSELERVIVHLTQEAGRCARHAESEADKLARFLGTRVDYTHTLRLALANQKEQL